MDGCQQQQQQQKRVESWVVRGERGVVLIDKDTTEVGGNGTLTVFI